MKKIFFLSLLFIISSSAFSDNQQKERSRLFYKMIQLQIEVEKNPDPKKSADINQMYIEYMALIRAHYLDVREEWENKNNIQFKQPIDNPPELSLALKDFRENLSKTDLNKNYGEHEHKLDVVIIEYLESQRNNAPEKFKPREKSFISLPTSISNKFLKPILGVSIFLLVLYFFRKRSPG